MDKKKYTYLGWNVSQLKNSSTYSVYTLNLSFGKRKMFQPGCAPKE